MRLDCLDSNTRMIPIHWVYLNTIRFMHNTITKNYRHYLIFLILTTINCTVSLSITLNYNYPQSITHNPNIYRSTSQQEHKLLPISTLEVSEDKVAAGDGHGTVELFKANLTYGKCSPQSDNIPVLCWQFYLPRQAPPKLDEKTLTCGGKNL